MSDTAYSLLIRYFYDPEMKAMQMQVIQTDTAEPVSLGNNSFLMRFLVDQETLVVRCQVRHIASGREAYVQGGPSLWSFIKACLLNRDEPQQQATVGEDKPTL
ncbi:MAG TPA: hypothetical protein VFA10_04380 [Ktedonobacteraceae bacterium]|jgi:hypothetical protein|nr:hypothetical protein [Ktedonobacteraceae bacterium]